MTIRGTPFRGLAAGMESERLAEAGGPHGRLRVPTLEERALILLRATKGKQDFTSDEYLEARRKILDSMAADIVSRSGPEAIDEADTTPTPTRKGTPLGDAVASRAMRPELGAQES